MHTINESLRVPANACAGIFYMYFNGCESIEVNTTDSEVREFVTSN